MTKSCYRVILTTSIRRYGISVPRFFCIIAYEVLVGEEINYMRRIIFLIFAIASIMGMMTTNVFSQEITVRFTGQLNGNDYCQLDSVVITNLTRDWSETVEYPDTIIVLGSTVGSNINIVAEQGLGQNIPNPFDCKTRVELSVSQREDVKMQLLDVAGRVYAEYNSSVDAGMHIFEISADNSQTYLLNAIIGKHQYSIRMVNVGSGCGYSIKYAGKSNGIKAKLASTNEFRTGDNMRYVGYATIEGELVESSAVEQSQVVNQYITLDFTYYFIPSIETLDATEITATTATLNAIITDDGGADVTARGFYYGLSPENLAYQAVSDVTTNSFSAIVTPLDANTTYYYKAYATNSEGTAIGNIVTFTTESISAPIVVTSSVTNITATSATLSGNVISDGGSTIIEQGFVYGTNVNELSQNVQTDSGIGIYTMEITGLTANTTYYYKAYATNIAGTSYGGIVSFTTMEGTTGTLNGHGWVDLGLPSGTRWATCNVGANTPVEYGDYFAWGETSPKNTYEWSNYIHCAGNYNTLTKYCTISNFGNNGIVDNITTLDANDDAANINWGSGWRTPTSAEIQELFDNCIMTWTTLDDVNGYLITGLNGNTIFLPAAGRYEVGNLIHVGSTCLYWSSSLRTELAYYALVLGGSSDGYLVSSTDRYKGLSVRPVCVQ